MTSDYVSYVLGLQGWERAWDEDSYMAGEEDVLARNRLGGGRSCGDGGGDL